MSKNSLFEKIIIALFAKSRQCILEVSFFTAMLFLPMHLQAEDHTLPPDISTPVTLDPGVNNVMVAGIGTIFGDIDGSGNLTKLGSGTLWLNGNNTFTGGVTLSAGSIGLGSDTAFGTWLADDPATATQGLVLITASDGKIIVKEDRTITNHFQLGDIIARTGSLAFDIAPGTTLTISGAENTSTDFFLENGGAINVNVPGSGTTSPLQFTGGNLVFSYNKSATNGGAVGAWFDGVGQSSVFDFMALDSITFTDNIAGHSGYGSGGGIYSYSTSYPSSSPSLVSLGNNVTFSDNIAGNIGDGSGGGILSFSSSSSVTLGSHTSLTRNRVGGNNQGGQGGAIRIYGNNSAALEVSGHTFFDGNLVSKDTSNSVGSFGGAIYIEVASGGTGTITLDADAGAIAFRGNKIDVDTTNPLNPTGGTANSIHMTGNTQLALTGSENIYFDDPISSGATGGNSLTKDGAGFVQFVGDNRLNTSGFAATNSVDITGGTFCVVNTGTDSFDATGAGNFNVAAGATLAGGGTIKSTGDFTISGTLSADNDRFKIPGWAGVENGVGVNTFGVGRDTIEFYKRLGTLNLVEGDLIMQAGSTLAIDLDQWYALDKINVTGDVTITPGSMIDIRTWATASNAVFLEKTAGPGFAVSYNVGDITFLGNALPTGTRNMTATVGGNGTQMLMLTTSQNDDNRKLYWRGDTDTWDMTQNNWTMTQGNTVGDTNFIARDYVIFDGGGVSEVTIAGDGQQVFGLEIADGSYTFNGNPDATIYGCTDAQNLSLPVGTLSGKLFLNTSGTTTLNVGTDFLRGIEMTQGTLVLGHDRALGVWVPEAPSIMLSGMFLATGNGLSTIKITEDRTITNHFQLGRRGGSGTGSIDDPDAMLMFDIDPGATLTITGVENTSTWSYIGVGGAISVNVSGSGDPDPYLLFAGGGNLVFSYNKAGLNGGAVGASFDMGHINFDFSDLSSLTFLGNIAGDGTLGYGGAIYSGTGSSYYSSSSVTTGDNVVFSGNIAGNGGPGYGGAIYSRGAANRRKRNVFG